MSNNDEQLKKSMNFREGANLVIGSIIGSGIFASPGVVFRHSGSGGAALLVWLISGLIGLMGALCYCELALLMPSAGAELTYLNRIYGKTVGFLFTWTSATVSRPCAFAITSIVTGQYLCRFKYGNAKFCDEEYSPEVFFIALLVICFVAVVNSVSSKLINSSLAISSTTSIASLIVAVVVGPIWVYRKSGLLSNIGFAKTSTDLKDFSPAFLGALWAYDGWNTLNYASEELKSVDDFVRIIRLVIPFITFLFIFVNATYLIVLKDEIVATSGTLGVDLAKSVFGSTAEHVMPLFVATSAFGSCVGNCFSGSRLVYSSAKDGFLPKFLAFISPMNSLPIFAVFSQACLGFFFLFTGNFEELIGVFSISTWVFYLLCVLGVMRLRFTEPNIKRPYQVPWLYPIIFCMACVFLILAEFFAHPRSTLIAFGFMALGYPFYYLQQYEYVRKFCCLNDVIIMDEADDEEKEEIRVSYNTF